jgi:oligopeptide/dipeptide ABC transporter ATP-binding protein
MSGEAVMVVEDLSKQYVLSPGGLGRKPRTLKAMDGISFELRRGEVLGLVGESGSGKSTVAKVLSNLVPATGGRVTLDGAPLIGLGRKAEKAFRKRIQMIFQDPFSSLNPRMRVRDILTEGMIIHGLGGDARGRHQKAVELMGIVGLSEAQLERFPHEFSGGQRQRISIARALSVDPDILIADEAVSALDVSIQAQIINLLARLRAERNLTMLFVAHDLAVVRHISDRVAVMYLGRIMEIGATEQLFGSSRHPYTRSLLAAVPRLNPDEAREDIVLEGDIPSPIDPPSGCVFRTRCPFAQPECAQGKAQLREVGTGHMSACIRADELYGEAIQ